VLAAGALVLLGSDAWAARGGAYGGHGFAVSGPRGGTFYSGPRGRTAFVGPRGGFAYSGPRGMWAGRRLAPIGEYRGWGGHRYYGHGYYRHHDHDHGRRNVVILGGGYPYYAGYGGYWDYPGYYSSSYPYDYADYGYGAATAYAPGYSYSYPGYVSSYSLPGTVSGLPAVGERVVTVQAAPVVRSRACWVEGGSVAAAQRELQSQGYYCGAIDGLIGPETRAAIRAYQADHGLVINGRLSNTFWRSIGR